MPPPLNTHTPRALQIALANTTTDRASFVVRFIEPYVPHHLPRPHRPLTPAQAHRDPDHAFPDRAAGGDAKFGRTRLGRRVFRVRRRVRQWHAALRARGRGQLGAGGVCAAPGGG